MPYLLRAGLSAVTLVHLAAVAQPCAVEKAHAQAQEFLGDIFSSAFSPECRERLGRLNASQFWLRQCEKPSGPLHAELNRRTEKTVVTVASRRDVLSAEVRFRGPSVETFKLALLSSRCDLDLSQSQALFGLIEPKQECGEEFWRGIPIVEWNVSMPLQCVAGKWTITPE